MREINLKIIHFAICSGLAIVLGLFYYLVSSGQVVPSAIMPLLFYMGMFIAVAAVVASRLLPAQMARKMKLPASGSVAAAELLKPYFMLKIIQWALLEGAGMYLAVVFFITGQEAALLIGVILLVLLVVRRPSREDLRKVLNLSDAVLIQE